MALTCFVLVAMEKQNKSKSGAAGGQRIEQVESLICWLKYGTLQKHLELFLALKKPQN